MAGPRLKIGTWILDAEESDGSSTSTVTGAKLLLPEDGPKVPTSPTQSTFVCFCWLNNVANESTLRTRVNAIKAAIADNMNNDVVFEYSANNALFEFKASDSSYQIVRGDVEVEYGRKSALIQITIVAERTGVAWPSGSGEPSGALDYPDWQYEQVVSGLPACIGSCQFKTLDDAVAWADQLRAGNQRPPFLHADFKHVNFAYQMAQQPSTIAPVRGDYKPCTLIATFIKLQADFANETAFDDIWKVTYGVSIDERELDARAGASYSEVLLSGQIELKTEQDATFDAGDTSVIASSAIRGIVDAAVDVVLTKAQTRLDETLVELNRKLMPGDLGTVYFTVVCMTAENRNNVMLWDESTVFRARTRDQKLFDYLGKSETFEHPAGNERSIEWRIRIIAAGKPVAVYLPPGWTSNYKLVDGGASPTIKRNVGTDGMPRYEFNASGVWEYEETAGPHADADDRKTLPKGS